VTTDLIVQLAQAGGLILLAVALITGQVWAKPAVDFLRAMLDASLDREAKLAEALTQNTAAMRDVITELRSRPR
jgi:hypothetical protein